MITDAARAFLIVERRFESVFDATTAGRHPHAREGEAEGFLDVAADAASEASAQLDILAAESQLIEVDGAGVVPLSFDGEPPVMHVESEDRDFRVVGIAYDFGADQTSYLLLG